MLNITKKSLKYLLILVVFLASPILMRTSVKAASDLTGLILLDVERHGEAWYVYPEDNKRYYLGRPQDAFNIMRELGLGINEVDFQRLAKAGMPVTGDVNLAKRLSGRIIIRVEASGEAWYIYPRDLKAYYLGRPDDAFRIMRELSLGISRDDLARVHKPGLDESLDFYSRYEHKVISTTVGDFSVDMVTIDLADPNLKIITDAVPPYPNEPNAPVPASYKAQPLGRFVIGNNGFAGINGTYFCSDSSCQANYYFYPVYLAGENKLVNSSQLKYWTTGPIMAWDENNKFYYFKDSREFVSVTHFEETYGVKLEAAIGNKPRLIENGMNLLIDWDIDPGQQNTKAVRNALAYIENPSDPGKGKVLLVVARSATVPDLADIMKALNVDYALNLDGGSSAALWYNDEYMIGPGRNIPNAVVFGKR